MTPTPALTRTVDKPAGGLKATYVALVPRKWEYFAREVLTHDRDYRGIGYDGQSCRIKR